MAAEKKKGHSESKDTIQYNTEERRKERTMNKHGMWDWTEGENDDDDNDESIVVRKERKKERGR